MARRFFANPYDPQQIYVLDQQHVMRSDDGGATWQVDASLEQQVTCGGLIPAARDQDADGQGDHYDIVLSDMQFDPFNPQRRFAVGLAGAFWTADGTTWERLFDTGSSRGRPANCYYDWISQPSDPALYVSFAGRSIVRISGFAPVVIFGPEEGDAARPAPAGVRSARLARRSAGARADPRRPVGHDAGDARRPGGDRLRRRRVARRAHRPTAATGRRHVPGLSATS